MSNITVPVSHSVLAKLKEIATKLRVTPEELVSASLQDLLGRPDEEFHRALDHVLKKNAELYERLA